MTVGAAALPPVSRVARAQTYPTPNQLMHLRIAEYVALIAMADVTGHFGVGVLLESCLADKVAFVERTRRLIRHTIESKHALKLAA
jgi:ferritin-like metal-binding protein YciE